MVETDLSSYKAPEKKQDSKIVVKAGETATSSGSVPLVYIKATLAKLYGAQKLDVLVANKIKSELYLTFK